MAVILTPPGVGGGASHDIDIQETQAPPGGDITIDQLFPFDYTTAALSATVNGNNATVTPVDADTVTITIPGGEPDGLATVELVADGVVATDTINIQNIVTYLEDLFTGSAGTDLIGRAPDTAGPAPTLVGTGTGEINASSEGECLTTSAGFASYTLQWDIGVDDNFEIIANFQLANIVHSLGLDAKIQDSQNRINFSVDLRDTLKLRRVVGGSETDLDTGSTTIVANQTYELRVTYVGDQITCYIDGNQELQATDATYAAETRIGARFGAIGDTIQDIVCRPFS